MEEYLDIVDKNDKVIGVAERGNLPADIYKKKFLRYVNIFILNSKNELLLPKRSMNRRLFPGKFDFSCAEHVQSGESYDHAALRGLKEELNLVNVQIKDIGKINPMVEKVSGFAEIYQVIYKDNIQDYDKEGIEKLEWIKLEKIKKMIKSNPEKFKGDFIQTFSWFIGRMK